MHPFLSDDVARIFDSYPPAVRREAMRLRALIFEVAAATHGVDRVEETLKWNEPAYVAYATSPPRNANASSSTPRFATRTERLVGSAIRIGWKTRDPERIRLLFHCQTTLIDSFREQFRGEFTFEGNRAMVFGLDDMLPKESLSACIAATLLYHAKNSS